MTNPNNVSDDLATVVKRADDWLGAEDLSDTWTVTTDLVHSLRAAVVSLWDSLVAEKEKVETLEAQMPGAVDAGGTPLRDSLRQRDEKWAKAVAAEKERADRAYDRYIAEYKDHTETKAEAQRLREALTAIMEAEAFWWSQPSLDENGSEQALHDAVDAAAASLGGPTEPHVGTCECGHADFDHQELRGDGEGFVCSRCPCRLLSIPLPDGLMPGAKLTTLPRPTEKEGADDRA